MDKGRDKQPSGSAAPKNADGPKASKPKEPIVPGSVVVDSRGRNVWHFHGEPIDSTSMMLQRLDNPALALEPTRKAKRLEPGTPDTRKDVPTPATGGRSAEAKARESKPQQSFEQRFKLKPGKKSGGGFDPYNRS
jgi:hypothetical protein